MSVNSGRAELLAQRALRHHICWSIRRQSECCVQATARSQADFCFLRHILRTDTEDAAGSSQACQCDKIDHSVLQYVEASAVSACKASSSVMHVCHWPSKCNFLVTFSSTVHLNGWLPHLPLPKFPVAICSVVT